MHLTPTGSWHSQRVPGLDRMGLFDMAPTREHRPSRTQDGENRATAGEGITQPRGWLEAGPGTYRKAAEEREARIMKSSMPCPLCKEEGRPGQVHSYQKSFPGWPSLGTMMWTSGSFR